MKTLHIILAICLSCLASQNVRAADTEDEWVVTGHGPIGVCVVREDCPLFNIQFRIFEDWSTWAKMKTLSKVIDGKRVFEERDITFYPAWKKPRPTGLDFNCVTSQRPDGSILFKYRLENDAPTDYHMPWDNRFGMKKQDGRERYGVGPFLLANTYFNDGRCLVEFSDGRSKTITLPPPAKWGKEEIRKLTLSTEDGQKTVFTFDPAIAMHCDHGDMRLFVRQSADAGKTVEQTMVMTLPVKTKFEHDNRWVDTSDWIVYENRHDYGPGSVIGVEDWLDKPAGKRGWVKQRPTWRNHLPVESNGAMPDGREFAGIAELRERLAANPAQLAYGVGSHLVTYATGTRPLGVDTVAIEQIAAQTKGDNYGFRSLLHAVIQSDLFRNK